MWPNLKKLILFLALLTVVVLSGADAMAAKKKGISPAEAQKILAEADTHLTSLLSRIQNRQLVSPEDAAKLTTLQLQLLELSAMPKPDPSLPKVLYQVAMILERREQYLDAADCYDTLCQKFADSPYGIKAKTAIIQLKKQYPKAFSSPSA
jgi:hypothetical protein